MMHGTPQVICDQETVFFRTVLAEFDLIFALLDTVSLVAAFIGVLISFLPDLS